MKASAVNEAARLIHGAADRKPTGLALLLAREGRLVGAHQAEELDRLEALVPELQARVAELELAAGAAAEQRHLLEPQDTFLTAGVARLRAELDAPDRIVAYRDPNNPTVLLCREHGERWSGVVPVTSEDLPDGGICTFGRLGSLECARDVLISGGGR